MKKIYRALLFLVIGILIGAFSTMLITRRQIADEEATIKVVVQPTRQANIKYKSGKAAYTFENPNQDWGVVVYDKSQNTYTLYRLADQTKD
ncbi:hypothetical protein [Lapidilactobacillus bayanensis]|uniref:hypothetical protein n=1 Tax=Lapidilactobacillus bayanensis TaxID=2485998 RepID=UPI000F77ADCE|nr:hypothetical protein [Lapidilactobacillus bayanensis]